MKNSIKIFGIVEILILASWFFSKSFYANLQVAFLSSFFIIFGSFYAYKRMIDSKVDAMSYEDDRDELDIIDDPHDLYDENPINDAKAEDLDLGQIVKEERAKIKTFSITSMKEGGSAGFSPYRLGGYIFLVLGFIALKNNDLLDISIYLPSLLVGIVVGHQTAKNLFS